MKAKLFEFSAKDKNRRAKSKDATSLGVIPSPHAMPYITSSADLMTFSPGSLMTFGLVNSVNESFSDYVFGEKDKLPIDVALKRIEKYKKKHPEEFTEPLEKMYKKAYPKEKKRLFQLFKSKKV